MPRLAALLLLAAPLAAEPGRNAMPQGFGAFLDWLQAGADAAGLGAEFPPFRSSFELRRGRFGQALFAARRFERGDTVAVLPPSRYRKGTWHSLAVFLAEERAKGAESSFAPWIAILPRDYSERPAGASRT